MDIIFEDEHLIVVNKAPGELAQADKAGGSSLVEKLKTHFREEGSAVDPFCGVVHRIDRPTSGVVIYAKSPESLEALNEQFRAQQNHKTYWAVVEKEPLEQKETLTHWLKKEEKQNKSFYFTEEVKGSKKAVLDYEVLAKSDRYFLLQIHLKTGRHHQIRSQLSAIGCPIKGDLKYGAKRSNKDGSIHLHARSLQFQHPISKKEMTFVAPVPSEVLWRFFEDKL